MAENENISYNRNYKDTVFRMVFANKDKLLDLYNALNGSAFDDMNQLEIVTLENAVYIGIKNDVSFIIDNR